MTTLYFLCAISPGYGCVPFATEADCMAALHRLAPVVEMAGCEAGEVAESVYAPWVSPMPVERP